MVNVVCDDSILVSIVKLGIIIIMRAGLAEINSVQVDYVKVK